jgi:hypothetical protein
MTDHLYGLPIDTPLDREPDARSVEALEMWRVALLHVGTLGGWDRTIAAWLSGKDAGIIASVAAWLRRAWQAGLLAGRREVLDETGGRDTDLHVLAADIERIADQADIQLTEGEAGAQEVLEELLQDVRARVSMDVDRAEVLARVAAKARRRYFSVLGGDLSPAQRYLAVSVAIDTVAVTTTCDSTLAAAVRAVIAADRQLDDAVAEVTDPPACGGCEHPLCPTRAGELCPRSAVDMARVDAVRGHSAGDGGCEDCGRRPARRVEPEDPSGVPVVLCGPCAGEDDDGLQPGTAIPGIPGFVVGVCGHRVAGSEWRAGFRTCERCPADAGHSTPCRDGGVS